MLAPTRRRSSPRPRVHDGEFVTERPDEMWAFDGTGECFAARAVQRGTRRDHRSQFISYAFQDELKFLGIRSSPSFVRSPEGNGCFERFIRTLKEQLLWIKRFATVDELDRALKDFAHRYNNHWIIGRLRYKTPAQHRRSFLVEAA